ncbi:MAG: 3'(2'),5'-bisphosphate nucleotidase CysQ [Acidobacteriia bacterium]|nr:3'(2'),5'-bisphosphate nucleotidase CysQ [Methyloceanibacter sp.]MBX5471806.1 3'(2'),5'-bisphosphate nucleotidase CysQ [Acetobacteraceae bacterium]MCL6490973.1 3'(2'),5'-bisphosphate nucleotidase CysQ [Terriglobia bacterium]
MTDQELLALAAELAEAAGKRILEIRAEGALGERRKVDKTLVTNADHASEALIVGGLRAAVPAIAIIAEEEIAAGITSERTDVFWLVDPLDGTREFTEGRDEFTVNIGLVRKGEPVLGVVYLPATDELFTGLRSDGARKRTRAGWQAISARTPPPEGLSVMASRHHGSDERLTAFLEGRKVARIIHSGSALKFCRLAEGAADLYPRFGRTMEWDTAGPQAVLEAAGGTVRLLDGSPLRYGKPGWENPPFVCTGRLSET